MQNTAGSHKLLAIIDELGYIKDDNLSSPSLVHGSCMVFSPSMFHGSFSGLMEVSGGVHESYMVSFSPVVHMEVTAGSWK